MLWIETCAAPIANGARVLKISSIFFFFCVSLFQQYCMFKRYILIANFIELQRRFVSLICWGKKEKLYLKAKTSAFHLFIDYLFSLFYCIPSSSKIASHKSEIEIELLRLKLYWQFHCKGDLNELTEFMLFFIFQKTDHVCNSYTQ